MAKTYVELTVAGKPAIPIQVENLQELRAFAAAQAGSEDFRLTEADHQDELKTLDDRTAVNVVAHRCTKALVTVKMDSPITNNFPVAQTVRKVLEWAVGKKGFSLDDNQAAKANLILPDGTEPLAKDALIGQYVSQDTCSVEFKLTLKDFSNG